MILVWIILGALILYKVQEELYRRYWDKDLFVSLEFSEESAVEGDMCALLERVENEKFLPLPALKVKFQVSRQLQFENMDKGSSITDQYYRNDVLSIKPYMRHVRTLPFLCKKRGYYEINGLDLVAGNLFLSNEMPKSMESDARLYVYPKPYDGQEFLQALQRMTGEVLCRRHLQEDPFEYRGIREYSYRDSMRDINWKATARTDELKVNQKSYTALQAVRLFINLEDGALMRQVELLEISIQMAVGAAQQFLGQGIRTALYTNGPDILSGDLVCLEAASGVGHMESINRGLARIDLDGKIPAFVQALRDVVNGKEGNSEVYTVFFSADGQEDFQRMLCECLEKKMDFLWICPVIPRLEPKIMAQLEPYTVLIAGKET
ncbi:MAG: DUF58 domain-containing protein [Lachnospiraceae bacterium]|nr:DUF58 domain-containing protein [Lachnospiraceae bacterium]